MRLVALKKVYYPAGNGVEYEAGDHFETLTDTDAEVLVAVGVAAHPKKAPTARKAMAASAPSQQPAPSDVDAKQSAPDLLTTTSASPLAGGTYNRRDMKAGE